MALKAYSQLGPDTAPCADNGYYVGAKGSEVQVIAGTGEVTNKVAKADGFVAYSFKDCNFAGGTWTITRNAASDYSVNKTAAGDTTYISADITGIYRMAASKGLKLTKIDYTYSIGTAALTAHSIAVNTVTYANNAAVVVASYSALTGALSTATQANPYHTVVTVNVPAFSITEDQKLNVEITVDCSTAATAVFKFYNLFLYFTHDYL